MLAQTFIPIMPPTRPSEPESLMAHYHADLTTLDASALYREEGALLARPRGRGRLSPYEVKRLAGITARLERE